MPTYGPTPTGFRRKTFAEIEADVDAKLHRTIAPGLDLQSAESSIANVKKTLVDEVSQVWEAAELGHNAFDPDAAVDFLIVGLARLTGVNRLPALPGAVAVNVTADDAVTFAAGQIVAHVQGDPTNTWANKAEVVFAGPGTINGVVFESTAKGSRAVAGAGTLVVSQTLTHLAGLTNPSDAAPGRDIETFEELRLRREDSLAAQGSTTLAAVLSAIVKAVPTAQVDGVENDKGYTFGGLPPKSFTAYVYDPGASNDTIAQVIFDTKSAGISSNGSTAGNVIDPQGRVNTLSFERAGEVLMFVRLSAVGTYDQAAVKQAIIDAQAEGVSKPVVWAKLIGAAANVDGVTDVPLFEIAEQLPGGSGPGTYHASNYATGTGMIALFDPTRIFFI